MYAVLINRDGPPIYATASGLPTPILGQARKFATPGDAADWAVGRYGPDGEDCRIVGIVRRIEPARCPTCGAPIATLAAGLPEDHGCGTPAASSNSNGHHVNGGAGGYAT